MTPAQRKTLAECRKRGFFLPDARKLADDIERIDATRRARAASAHPMHVMCSERMERGRMWRRLELAASCLLILLFLFVALFL